MTIALPLLVPMAGGKPRARRAPAPRESKLQTDVVKLLAAHCLSDWLWRHISAKAANAREGGIMKRMGVRAGWPDFILISPYGSVRFLELKRQGEDIDPDSPQDRFRLHCIAHGIPHVVAWTMADVLTALDQWGCTRLEITARRLNE